MKLVATTNLIRSLNLLLVVLITFLIGKPLSIAQAEIQPVRVIIDTDAGVDDTVAIAWLLEQEQYPTEVLGIVSVAGNTTTENSANNILTLLEVTGNLSLEVVIGAYAPLVQPPSTTGASTHGPDGLWYTGFQHPHDLSSLSTDATGFYCSHSAPDVVIVALGPLTNLANAAVACPAEMRTYSRIIALGGARAGGNRTANAEFNIWYDPEAAYQVFTAGIPTTLVTLDAFNTFTITPEDLVELQTEGTPVGQFLSAPLQIYAQVQAGLGGTTRAVVPDVVAIMYTVDSSLGTPQSALVKVVPDIMESDPERLFRGQTVVGLTVSERIPMIADDGELSWLANQIAADPAFDLQAAIGAILAREPDNAQVVLDVQERQMHRLLMRALTE